MKALAWHGKHDVRVDNVPDPEILNPRDAIIRVTATAICGSDLHLYDGVIPTMQAGDILGHEFMGIVEDVGSGVGNLQRGDRVVVPFAIACGACFFCKEQLYSCCDNSNPAENQEMGELAFGASTAGLFGYSHLTGGYAGGQAEYVRVPYADVGPLKVPDGLSDLEVLFLSDILPTGWMAAENCEIGPRDTVAVWGAGPVGLFAAQSALLMGAAQVVVIDHHPGRLALARELGALTIDYRAVDVMEALSDLTGGLGPDAVIDAVGMESHGLSVDNLIDRAKTAVKLSTERPAALRQAIMACRKGGRVSMPGVYGGVADSFPLGAVMQKGLTIRTGQTHVQRYMPMLLDLIEGGRVDTTFLVSHEMALEAGPEAYDMFRNQQNEVTKVVLRP
jgi:threonine dehydrogenase-like Zn-dependent dehydrogenase